MDCSKNADPGKTGKVSCKGYAQTGSGSVSMDTGDYPDSTTAPAIDLYVYVEDAVKTLTPGHRGVMLGG